MACWEFISLPLRFHSLLCSGRGGGQRRVKAVARHAAAVPSTPTRRSVGSRGASAARISSGKSSKSWAKPAPRVATFREVIPLRRATPSTAADQSATTARSCTPGVHPGSGGAGSPLGPSLAARDSNPLLGGELVVIQVRCRTPINKMGALGSLPLLPPPAARPKLPVCPASRPYYIPGDWALRRCSPNHHHAMFPRPIARRSSQ